MSSSSKGTGCIGRLVLLTGIAALAAVVWHSHQDRLERRLTSLGAEVYYARGERAMLLAERIKSSAGGKVGASTPQVIDRLFGRLVTVHFGRTADLRGTDPVAVVKALCDLPHLRTVLIDGLPLRDADLLRLMEAPALAEVGLKNTEVTEAGIQAARARRPGVEIKQLDTP